MTVEKFFDALPFTTRPSRYIVRGNKTIRKRCLEFVETLRVKQIKELPMEAAKEIFSQIIDVWDRTTIKAYFGCREHKSVQKIGTRKQYSSGNISQATIELSRQVTEYRGYLERLRLVHFEQRGHVVFMVLETANLTPEFMKPAREVGVFNDNFSLSSRSVERSEENLSERMGLDHSLGCPENGGLESVGERKEREGSQVEKEKSVELK